MVDEILAEDMKMGDARGVAGGNHEDKMWDGGYWRR